MFVCSEAVVAQVLDELGLQMADQLSGNFLCTALADFFYLFYVFMQSKLEI